MARGHLLGCGGPTMNIYPTYTVGTIFAVGIVQSILVWLALSSAVSKLGSTPVFRNLTRIGFAPHIETPLMFVPSYVVFMFLVAHIYSLRGLILSVGEAQPARMPGANRA